MQTHAHQFGIQHTVSTSTGQAYIFGVVGRLELLLCGVHPQVSA